MNQPPKRPANPMPVLSLRAEGLSCVRGDQQIFSPVRFSVSAGELLLLRGPNGSGKSSLLMCLAGLLPFQGELAWDIPQDLSPEGQKNEIIHYAGHLNAMKPELSLSENLCFWAALFGGDRALIGAALEKSGLGGLGNYSAGNLSAGQKHRLSLARLLVSKRAVWLLDEPSSALDRQGDEWVAGLISDHLEQGGIVIAATHRPISLGPGAAVHTITLGET
jgi:heme exporter protein A